MIETKSKLGVPKAIEINKTFISIKFKPNNKDKMGVVRRIGIINKIHITNNFAEIIILDENPSI